MFEVAINQGGNLDRHAICLFLTLESVEGGSIPTLTTGRISAFHRLE